MVTIEISVRWHVLQLRLVSKYLGYGREPWRWKQQFSSRRQ